MIVLGMKVQDPASKSFGIIERACKNSGPDRYEVKITERKVGTHHKDGDIVIWEIKG